MKINLLDNLIPNPLVEKPDWEKIQSRWQDMENKKGKPAKRKITMCGCGKHPVNPKKDVYKQHNHWLAQQHPKTENNFSKLQGMKSFNEK